MHTTGRINFTRGNSFGSGRNTQAQNSFHFIRSHFIRRADSARLEQKQLHPVIRTVLPALASFEVRGDSDYLEDLVARIDCPRLKSIR